jgi:hypothetical protein
MSADGDGKYPGLNEDDRLQITGRIIHATWDIAPSEDGETPRPFLYWKTDTERGCASTLIKRCVIVLMSYFMYVFMSYFMYVFMSYFVVNKHQIGHENNNVPLN